MVYLFTIAFIRRHRAAPLFAKIARVTFKVGMLMKRDELCGEDIPAIKPIEINRIIAYTGSCEDVRRIIPFKRVNKNIEFSKYSRTRIYLGIIRKNWLLKKMQSRIKKKIKKKARPIRFYN